MKYPKMIAGTLIRRLTRFSILAETPDGPVTAFLPNSGRLAELLAPGAPVRLIPVLSPDRKTHFDFALVQYKKQWISVNANLANDLFHEALIEKRLTEFNGMEFARREVTKGRSRFDFLLRRADKDVFVEVKSASLVISGQARFPDAPTTRGARHAQELAALARQGTGAGRYKLGT